MIKSQVFYFTLDHHQRFFTTSMSKHLPAVTLSHNSAEKQVKTQKHRYVHKLRSLKHDITDLL